MNLRAKCVNKQCPAYGIEKSVTIETYAGFGAPNDRIICRTCGQLMRTTRSISLKDKGGSGKLVVRGVGTTTGNIKYGKTKIKKAATRKRVARKKI